MMKFRKYAFSLSIISVLREKLTEYVMELLHKASWIKRDKLMRMPWSFKSCLFPLVPLALSGCGVVDEELTGLNSFGGTDSVPPDSVPPASGGTGPSSSPLAAPVVNVTANGASTILGWDGSNADQYRIFYWHGNEMPQEHTTNSTTFTLPPLSRWTYTVIVEAYDSLGNSLFSAPVKAVVS